MLFEALSAARDIGRLHDIASILIRFGFGDMVRRLGMGKALEQAGRILHWKQAEELACLEPPERIRRALEEMGPSYVKLGQILASRIDLFPPEYIEEFEKLQDRVPPGSFDELAQQLEEEFGASLNELFSNVERESLAAASIAQVHRARLASGDEVILKIRRPGIRSVVEADLRLLMKLAEIAEHEFVEFRQFRPKDVVSEFSKSMRRELDLADECRNAERIAANFKENPNILVPKVYQQWTTECLNVQQYIDGIPGRDLEAVDKAGLDRKLLAKRGADAVLKMIFEDGFFHADPHPGNVFYLPGDRIVFIDFGMVGRLSEERRHQLVDLLYGVVKRRADQVVEILLLWAKDGEADEEALLAEIDTFIDRIHGMPLKSLNLTLLISDLIALLREHKLSLPPDLTLLIKAFISLEGMGKQLDPEFDMLVAAEPFLRSVMLARYAPDALLRRGRKGITDAFELMTGLPNDVRNLVRTAQKGRLKLKIDVDRMEHYLDRLDRSVSRLTMGIVIAALIIGSSIVMTVAGGQIPLSLSFFAMLGFFIAVIGGIWLLISIWRKG